jgi:hypothetical protein
MSTILPWLRQIGFIGLFISYMAVANQALSAAPDWPDMNQPSPQEASLYGPGRLRWETREDLVRRYGADQLAYVEVVNEGEVDLKMQLPHVIRAAAPKAAFLRYRQGRAVLGPVSDFEAFCRALDIGQIVERDDAAKFVRIKVDSKKFLAKARVVRIEIVNYQEFAASITDPNSPNDPFHNLQLLLQLAAGPRSAEEVFGQKNEIVEIAPVRDFARFCANLDFVEIVAKDAAERSLKIRVKPDQLTRDAVVKRTKPDDELRPWERRRLGLEVESIARDEPRNTDDSPDRLEPPDTTSPAADLTRTEDTAPTAGSGGLQREYARLAQLLNSNDVFGKQEAAQTLLRVRPSDVANAETRKLIARGYRSLAMEGHGHRQEEAIRGLVIWGGKYSVPVLIELLEKEGQHPSDELFTALGQLKDPRGAEAVARHLGNFFNHDAAVASLRRMGPAAEAVLIDAAPSNDAKASLAAVQLLGDVGGEKSLQILQRATQARNPEIKLAARNSIKRIRTRQKSGGSANPPDEVDPDSPFAEGSGPAVDITGRNSQDYADRIRRDRGRDSGMPPTDDVADGELEVADLNEGDWSQVNALLPGDSAGAGVPADPARDQPPAEWKPQPTRLGKPTSNHERAVAIDVAGGKSPLAVVVYEDPFSKSMSRMEHANMQRRRVLGSTNVLGGVKQCYLSPSAARVLLVGEEGVHNSRARLDVWTMTGAKPAEQATWWPFATTEDHWANQMAWADWVDDEQLLAMNQQGTLVLWRLDGNTSKAIYQIDAEGSSVPALSPGRAHLALTTQRGVEIFRASDGELLARMSDVRPGAAGLAFNADGTRLACVSGKSVYIWDATTGKLQRDFDCANLRSGSVSWLDNEHLLVGGTDIVDIPRRIILWRYEVGYAAAASSGGWQWLVMSSGNILGIVPAKLLHEEVLAAAKNLNPEEILALKPGAKVSLDIQLGGDEQAKAESALKAALEQNGVEVAPDQPLRLSARIVTGDSQTKEYGRGFFNREDREQVTVTEKRYDVELTVDGQSAWKQTSLLQSGYAPHAIWMERGETAQQAVDRQNQQFSSRFSFSASIPRYVVHPKYAGPLGTSKISLGSR